MKLAASSIAWSADEHDAAARVLEAAGARGVEVAPGMLFDDPGAATDAEIATARTTWADRGLEIVALQALLFNRSDLVLFGNREQRSQTAEHLRSMTRMAAGLGAQAMVFGSPRNRQRGNLSLEEATTIALEFFSELGEYAVQHGVAFCLEANAPDYGCDFICRTDEAVALVTQLDSPGCRVQIDTSTMVMNGEDCRASTTHAAPVAQHLHISEPSLGRVGPAGRVPVATVLSAAGENGYSGWISIEMRAGQDGENLTALTHALEHVARANETG